jgi:hypothetical protein
MTKHEFAIFMTLGFASAVLILIGKYTAAAICFSTAMYIFYDVAKEPPDEQ